MPRSSYHEVSRETPRCSEVAGEPGAGVGSFMSIDPTTATLGMDATLIEAHKREARPQSARLRLGHNRARTDRTALAGAPRSGGQANQLFRPHSQVERAYVLFPTWQVLLESLAAFSIPPDLIKARDSP
jgi:hypothetical protein